MNGSAPICATSTSGWAVTDGYRNVSLSHYLGTNALTRPRRRSDVEAETDSDNSSPSSSGNNNNFVPALKDSVIADENGNEQEVRWWIPAVDQERINIPTVHIHGAKDGWLKEANDLLVMCDPKTAVVWQHSGGHEIPKRADLAKKVAEMIQQAAVKSETMMY